MGQALQNRIKQSAFESCKQEALLNLLVSYGYIRTQLDRVHIRYGLTHGQYNVLRILRGAYPKGYPRCDIIERMLEPAPDVTRLIDRLIKMELVERIPSAEDKRLSIAVITSKGIELLDAMWDDMQAITDLIFKNLSDEQCRQLSERCEQIYSANDAQNEACLQESPSCF